MMWTECCWGWRATRAFKNATNSALVWRVLVWPMASPLRTVTVILKAVALGPTRGKRQHRIKPVKSLGHTPQHGTRRLLVDVRRITGRVLPFSREGQFLNWKQSIP